MAQRIAVAGGPGGHAFEHGRRIGQELQPVPAGDHVEPGGAGIELGEVGDDALVQPTVSRQRGRIAVHPDDVSVLGQGQPDPPPRARLQRPQPGPLPHDRLDRLLHGLAGRLERGDGDGGPGVGSHDPEQFTRFFRHGGILVRRTARVPKRRADGCDGSGRATDQAERLIRLND